MTRGHVPWLCSFRAGIASVKTIVRYLRYWYERSLGSIRQTLYYPFRSEPEASSP